MRAPLVALVIVLAGCAGRGAGVRDGANPPSLLEALRADVVAQAAEPWHEVRYNPVSCQCPPFELRIEGVWMRVALSPPLEEEETPTAALLAAAQGDADEGALRTYALTGALDDDVLLCATNAPVVELDVQAFYAEVPPPLPPAAEEEPASEAGP